MPNDQKSAPHFFSGDSPRPHRIRPWRMFIGSMIPNWLQCRREINQGAKLAYARLAQHAGKDGECFPKQETLAVELGVSERTANEYVRTLVKFRLIEKERPGLGMSNRYFFLYHPWIHEGQPLAPSASGQERQESSAPEQQNPSGQDRQGTSAPTIEENQDETNHEKRKKTHTQGHDAFGLPHSLEEAVEVARELGIEEEFATQEYHAKKSVGWKDCYGNPITSWRDHLQARWPTERRKRAERQANIDFAGNVDGFNPTEAAPPPERNIRNAQVTTSGACGPQPNNGRLASGV